MKKVFNRVFAAAVAVPVALSQAFATTSAEEVTKVISVDRMLYIKPGETVSEWGADVESAMMGLAGINNTFDLNSVIASVSTDNQYYKLIKDLFALSEKPIVSVNNEATAATVSGTLNVQDFVNDVVIPDSMKNVDFGDYTITNPVADVQNITYSMTASFDGIVDTKTFLGNATFAEVNGTAIDDIFGYLNNVMDSVKTQLVDQIYAQVAEQEVEKKLAEKIAEAEAEGTVIDDEKLAELRTEAINSITPEDMADAKAEIESKVNAEISKYKNKINKLNEWYNKSLKWEKDKTYANMDEFLAALSAKVSNTTNGAFATPATVSGLSEYSSTLDSFVAQVNAISTPKGVKLEITMDDIMSVLSEATDVHVTSAESEYEMTFQIPDAEAEAEAEAYKPTAPDKAYDSSYKIVTLRGNINGKSAFFDVERVVIEKDVEETTTTSATTTTTNETTTTSSETTTSETTTSEVTTTSSETTTSETTTSEVTTTSSETTTSETTTSEVTTTSSETTASETTTSEVTTTSSETTTSETTTSEVTTTSSETTTSETTTSEVTTTSSETTTSETTTSGVTTTSSETTTSETTTTSTESVVEFVVKDTPAFYFSVDENEFNAADLFESVKLVTKDAEGNVLSEEDIISDVNFNGATPKSVYDEAGEPYFVGNVQAYYNGEVIDGAEAKIYVGVKGDSNLSGDVTVADASTVLSYYAKNAAGLDFKDYAFQPQDELLNAFAYFLADVDTESKLGKDEGNNRISVADASNILSYYAKTSAGLAPKWEDIIPSLKK